MECLICKVEREELAIADIDLDKEYPLCEKHMGDFIELGGVPLHAEGYTPPHIKEVRYWV